MDLDAAIRELRAATDAETRAECELGVDPAYGPMDGKPARIVEAAARMNVAHAQLAHARNILEGIQDEE